MIKPILSLMVFCIFLGFVGAQQPVVLDSTKGECISNPFSPTPCILNTPHLPKFSSKESSISQSNEWRMEGHDYGRSMFIPDTSIFNLSKVVMNRWINPFSTQYIDEQEVTVLGNEAYVVTCGLKGVTKDYRCYVWKLNPKNVSIPTGDNYPVNYTWSIEGLDSFSSVVISENSIYFASWSPAVMYQMDRNLTTLKANMSIGDLCSGDALVNGMYTYFSCKNRLYQVSTINSSQVVSIYTGVGTIRRPLLLNGMIIVADAGSGVIGLNPLNVSQNVTSYFNDGISTDCSNMLGDEEYVYIECSDSRIGQYDAHTLHLLNIYYDGASNYGGRMSLGNGFLYTASGSKDNGYMRQLNASNITKEINRLYLGKTGFNVGATTPLFVFVTTLNTNKLYQLDAINISKLKGTWLLPTTTYGTASVVNTSLYIGSGPDVLQFIFTPATKTINISNCVFPANVHKGESAAINLTVASNGHNLGDYEVLFEGGASGKSTKPAIEGINSLTFNSSGSLIRNYSVTCRITYDPSSYIDILGGYLNLMEPAITTTKTSITSTTTTSTIKKRRHH